MDIFYINIIFFEGVGNDATDPRHQTAIAPPFIIIINIMIIGSIFHFIRFFLAFYGPHSTAISCSIPKLKKLVT